MQGSKLVEELVQAVGLPTDLVRRRLQDLADTHGLDLERSTLEDLRVLLADLLQDVLLELKADLNQPP